MESKLSRDEINALQSLGLDKPAGSVAYRDGELPQRLFAFNLVTRQPSGTTVLTKSGERALFGQACVSGLAAIERGESSALSNGVQKWLLSSGFINAGGAGGRQPAITARGKLWLASFREEAAVLAEPEDTAADFARRRS